MSQLWGTRSSVRDPQFGPKLGDWKPWLSHRPGDSAREIVPHQSVLPGTPALEASRHTQPRGGAPMGWGPCVDGGPQGCRGSMVPGRRTWPRGHTRQPSPGAAALLPTVNTEQAAGKCRGWGGGKAGMCSGGPGRWARPPTWAHTGAGYREGWEGHGGVRWGWEFGGTPGPVEAPPLQHNTAGLGIGRPQSLCTTAPLPRGVG